MLKWSSLRCTHAFILVTFTNSSHIEDTYLKLGLWKLTTQSRSHWDSSLKQKQWDLFWGNRCYPSKPCWSTCHVWKLVWGSWGDGEGQWWVKLSNPSQLPSSLRQASRVLSYNIRWKRHQNWRWSKVGAGLKYMSRIIQNWWMLLRKNQTSPDLKQKQKHAITSEQIYSGGGVPGRDIQNAIVCLPGIVI